MKQIHNTTCGIITMVICSLQLPLQGQDADSLAQYEIDYRFSGKVENKTDSVYQAYLVIDDSEILKTERLYIKVGTEPGTSDIFKLAVYENVLQKREFDSRKDGEERLNRMGDQVRIYLGDFTDRNHFLEVNFKDKKGRYSSAQDKRNTHTYSNPRIN